MSRFYICVSLVALICMGIELNVLREKYRRLESESVKHYQMACTLSDIVRCSIDNGDTIAAELYKDLHDSIALYNVSFDAEELDTLYWCY